MGNKEEIAKQVYPDVDGYLEQVEHDRIQFIRGLEYSDQQNKQLLARVAELEKTINKLTHILKNVQEQLKAKENEIENTKRVMQTHINEQDELIKEQQERIGELDKANKTSLSAWSSKHEDLMFALDKINEYSDKNKQLLDRVDELEKANVKLSDNIKNATIDISNYLNTLELRNDFNNDIAEFTRKRDWFMDYILNQLK